ncbi:restriction endonuclease subunit S [Lactiplantibacillus plantarum]|nr:restriction endonuclease subunit S [Lactiplantibacillus plantarum]
MHMKVGFANEFFNIWLTTPKALTLYKVFATGSLIEKQRIQFPTLSEIKTQVPALEEQIQIGTFFNKTENLIALHQRKLDKLKELKQGYLQKMFPQKWQQVPTIKIRRVC